MTLSQHRADPLAFGHGPQRFEIFIEPTCPYSVRAFGKVRDFLNHVGEDRVTVYLRLQSQPWHLFSPVVTRAVLAASIGQGGRKAAWTVLEAVAAHREEFEFDQHCKGPNRSATPDDIIARLENYSGVALKDAFDLPELEAEMKWHAKYGRQNGIHVSPTFMVNGLVQADLGSGDTVQVWAAKLGD